MLRWRGVPVVANEMISARRGNAPSIPTQSDGLDIGSDSRSDPSEPDRLPASAAKRTVQHSRPLKFRIKRLEGRAYSLDQSFEAPPGDAAAVLVDLLPRAEAGDEIAAFTIYLKFSACLNELDRARDAAQSPLLTRSSRWTDGAFRLTNGAPTPRGGSKPQHVQGSCLRS